MGRHTVPVIVTNIFTGDEVRYPSFLEAAAAIGARSSSVQKACLGDYQCKGYRIRREDDWIMDKWRK